MDLSHPLSDVTGSAHGDVLRTLLRAREPLTGREVARRSQRSARGAALVLAVLVESGLVTRREHPPVSLFALEEEHLAVPLLRALDQIWPASLRRMIRGLVASWEIEPVTVAVFGSVARGESGPDSDIDLLVLRRPEVRTGETVWERQLSDLERAAHRATGNPARVVEYTPEQLQDNLPLRRELLRDALVLVGAELAPVLRLPQRSS